MSLLALSWQEHIFKEIKRRGYYRDNTDSDIKKNITY